MSYVKNSKIKDIIQTALAEDIGKGDITAKLLVPVNKKARAVIMAKEKGIVCGIDIARLAFKLLDNNIRFIPKVKDGNRIKPGQILASMYGKASNILSAERVALNFLGLLSGIATRTAKFVNKVKKYRVKIMDTRKTLPGLRELQKYAVKIGGGYNHRFRLDEMVLVKDNHLVTSSIKKIINNIIKRKPNDVKLEIEVKNLREFKEALKVKPDIIMLDNMRIGNVRKAAKIRRRMQEVGYRIQLEASGSVNLRNIRAFAQSGVDVISLGTLTKDIHCLDLSLEIK